MNSLAKLHADIDSRVAAIREDNPDWLCRMGCDGCCHRLAEIPKLTTEEWNWLQKGLAALPQAVRRDIGEKITALTEQISRPIVCPMLDLTAGACRIYNHRPIACRTYGFYVQRDKGLYCKDIEAQVAKGEWAEVVWGNQDAIDHRLGKLGDARELTEWFASWKESGGIV
ncbi:MAG: YkgJ family cysteine cluster protein [Methylococcales bacterium]|nr:YkgJ family cysteine cluster protein [Methylococcaceae bacterium]